MPNKIKPKRSYTANAVPTTSDVDTHELAINWADGKAYTKNAAGNIVTVTLGGGGGGSGEDAVLRALFVPPAPTSVTATAGNAQATVSWTAPTGVLAQAPVSDYVVQYSTNSGSTWTTFSDGTSTATSATVTGLTNGTAYTFRVAAANAVGTGAYSTASSAVTPGAGDPLFANVQLLIPGDTSTNDASSYSRSVTAVGGAASSATQSRWGGGSIYFDGSDDYLTIPSSTALDFGGGNFVVEAWFKTSQTTSEATLLCREWVESPWTNAWTVQFLSSGVIRIYATSYSTSSPLLVGSTPCRDGNWHHFAWVRSGSTHKLFIDGAVDASAESAFPWTSATKDITVGNDLTFGGGSRAYQGYIDDLRITVGSDRGMTGSTITVPTAAFQAPISAPTSLAATGGNAQVSLAWTAPSYNGGSAITDYSVQFSSNGGSTWSNFSRTASTTASQIVTGLTNGTAYVFRVAGINTNGTGTYTAASTAVTPSAVSAPTAVRSLVANEQAQGNTVSWLAPLSDGGSAITGYRVVVTGSFVNSGTTTQSASERTKFIDSGSRNAFTVTVYAVNAVGESPGVTVSGETGDNS